MRLSNFEITFADSPLFAALDLHDEPALVLGMNALRAFERVAIDFPTRRVLFDLPPGAGLPRPTGPAAWVADRRYFLSEDTPAPNSPG